MRHFLGEVHEFKGGNVQIEDWEKALALTTTLTMPETSSFIDIKIAVQNRDVLIRKALVEFIGGLKCRVD